MTLTAVNPQPGLVNVVPVGGTAVTVATPPMFGVYIVNPLTAADQGIGAAEPLYINPTGSAATTQARGGTCAIAPGQSWSGIPGSIDPVSVNAPTSGHQFVCVRW